MKNLGRIYIANHINKPCTNSLEFDLYITLEDFVLTEEEFANEMEQKANTNDLYVNWQEFNDKRFNGCPTPYSQLKQKRRNLILLSVKKVNLSKAIQYIISEIKNCIDYSLALNCGDLFAIIDELQRHNCVVQKIELDGAQTKFILNKNEVLTSLGYDQLSSKPEIWKKNKQRVLENKFLELNHLYTEQKKELVHLKNEHKILSEKNLVLFNNHEKLKVSIDSSFKNDIHFRSLPYLTILKYLSKTIDLIPVGINKKEESDKKTRRILSTVNSRTDLCNDSRHQLALNFTLYNKSSNIMCTFIPKNGCTNLRYSFAMANGLIDSKEEFDWIHSNNTTMMASHEAIIAASLNFIILRCPFARLASYFIDKLISSTENIGDKSYDLALGLFSTESGELTFEKFVDSLWNKPDLIHKDLHIKHQSDFLVMQDYDYWFDVTQFDNLRMLLKEECNFELLDTRKLTSHTSSGLKKADNMYFGDVAIRDLAHLKRDQNSVPNFQRLYNKSSIEKIALLYLSDLLMYTNKIKNIPERSILLINQASQIL